MKFAFFPEITSQNDEEYYKQTFVNDSRDRKD